MGAVQISINENIGMHSSQFNLTESMNPMRIMQPNNCDASTSIFNQNLYGGQSNGTSTMVQNPFECDINAINSNVRSMRNPLSTFAPTYQTQNGYMSTNPMQFGTMMNPIQTTHPTQTSQQQTISYNQTNFYLPIQTTSSINAATYYDNFNASDQNHFIGQ